MKQIDQAQKFDALFNDQALINHRRQRPPQPNVPAPDYRECDDCGEEIPQARLKIYPSACRCTECQTQYDRRQARVR